MIWLYSLTNTARLQYTCKLFCDALGGISCHIESDLQAFRNKSGVYKINYSAQDIEDAYQIMPCGILDESDLNQSYSKLFIEQSAAFETIDFKGQEAPFDVLGAVFFLVSRYEEYLPFNADPHGRFPASESLLCKAGLLQKPIINIWAKKLRQRLHDEGFKPAELPFAILPTIDVDVAFRYKARSLGRHLAASLKDITALRFDSVRERFAVLGNSKPDPNDTFAYQFECFRRNQCDAKYFIQVGPYGQYDRNTGNEKKLFRQLVREIDTHYEAGIHPSYASNSSFRQLLKETGTIAEIIGRKVVISRQHFLKLSMPHTYRHLIECGIEQDYSMGYSDTLGFRAGIASPFPWFDLHSNQACNLQLVPFCVMDVTLQHFMSLDIEQALASADSIKHSVREQGGLFSFVFHNESLSDTRQWKGWRQVFEQLLHE